MWVDFPIEHASAMIRWRHSVSEGLHNLRLRACVESWRLCMSQGISVPTGCQQLLSSLFWVTVKLVEGIDDYNGSPPQRQRR